MRTFTHAFGKGCTVPNTFLYLFSNEVLVIKAGILKMLLRVVNKKNPDQIQFNSKDYDYPLAGKGR